MRLNELSDKRGTSLTKRRLGRGIGSGRGGTSGRGHKGQKSRSGVAIKGFEGGQMPIYRRLPKRGFSNVRFSKNLAIVNLGRIQSAITSGKLPKDKVIDSSALVSAGLIRRAGDGVRILADGDITDKITIKAYGISSSALSKLEKAGGSFERFPPERVLDSALVERMERKRAEKLAKRSKKKSDESTTDEPTARASTESTPDKPASAPENDSTPTPSDESVPDQSAPDESVPNELAPKE